MKVIWSVTHPIFRTSFIASHLNKYDVLTFIAHKLALSDANLQNDIYEFRKVTTSLQFCNMHFELRGFCLENN